jgi:hypothetical protein
MSLAEYLPKPPPFFSKLADIFGNLRAVQFVVAKVSALLIGSKASVRPLVRETSAMSSGFSSPGFSSPGLISPGFSAPTDERDAAASTASDSEDIAEPEIRAAAKAVGIVHAYAAVQKPERRNPLVQSGAIATSASVITAPQADDKPAREKLIRRRWSETGIKLWNPAVHGAGNAGLNIQGGVGLLPPKPGGTLPRYDTLEFRTLRSHVDGHEVIRIVCEGVAVDPPQRRSRDGLRKAQ